MVLENLFKKKVEPVDELNDITPLTLNLCLSKVNGSVQAELRKRFIINEKNKLFWSNFFEHSLSEIPIKVDAQIVFRDKFASKQKFKELGLLSPGGPTLVKEVTEVKKESKKNGLLDSFTKELNSDSMQSMAKNSKKWVDEEFFK